MGRASVAKKEATNYNSAYTSLEAELQKQRDATAAWKACVAELAQGHVAISDETARMATASREALCRGASGIDSSYGGVTQAGLASTHSYTGPTFSAFEFDLNADTPLPIR